MLCTPGNVLVAFRVKALEILGSLTAQALQGIHLEYWKCSFAVVHTVCSTCSDFVRSCAQIFAYYTLEVRLDHSVSESSFSSRDDW